MTRACLRTTFSGFDETALRDWIRREKVGHSVSTVRDVWILCPSTVCAATWQSATAAWLAGHRVILKPSRREPVFAKLLVSSVKEIAKEHLPVKIRTRLPRHPSVAARWVVYGKDETLETLRRRARMRPNLIGFGSRLSVAVIGKCPAPKNAWELYRKAAWDVVLYDTQGCLSPRAFFVRRRDAAVFARGLARAMEVLDQKLPRRVDSPLDAESFWQQWKFRASQGRAKIFRERVVLQEDFPFEPCGLRRVVFVIPFRSEIELRKRIRPWRSKLSTVALLDSADANRWKKVFGADHAIRWCDVGKMHRPPPSWRNGGVSLIKALRS